MKNRDTPKQKNEKTEGNSNRNCRSSQGLLLQTPTPKPPVYSTFGTTSSQQRKKTKSRKCRFLAPYRTVCCCIERRKWTSLLGAGVKAHRRSLCAARKRDDKRNDIENSLHHQTVFCNISYPWVPKWLRYYFHSIYLFGLDFVFIYNRGLDLCKLRKKCNGI